MRKGGRYRARERWRETERDAPFGSVLLQQRSVSIATIKIGPLTVTLMMDTEIHAGTPHAPAFPDTNKSGCLTRSSARPLEGAGEHHTWGTRDQLRLAEPITGHVWRPPTTGTRTGRREPLLTCLGGGRMWQPWPDPFHTPVSSLATGMDPLSSRVWPGANNRAVQPEQLHCEDSGRHIQQAKQTGAVWLSSEG